MTIKTKTVIFLLTASLTLPAFGSAPLPAKAKFDTGFSPKHGALHTVLKGIEAAKSSIQVAAYAFTSKPIAMALLKAQQRGVNVLVVADKKANTKLYSAAQFLANHDVPVRLNGHYSIHHHKFMIIDQTHLQLGSFNYSAAADSKNAENVLLLWNVKPIADTYSREWQRLWDEATPLSKAY